MIVKLAVFLKGTRYLSNDLLYVVVNFAACNTILIYIVNLAQYVFNDHNDKQFFLPLIPFLLVT